MRKKRIVPGCSALSLRYCSSIGVDSTIGSLAGHDVVRKTALPAQALSQGARLVARRVRPRAHAEDGCGLTPLEHLDIAHAGEPQVLRERVGELPAGECAHLDRVSPPIGRPSAGGPALRIP